jgi:hypothetical protein
MKQVVKTFNTVKGGRITLTPYVSESTGEDRWLVNYSFPRPSSWVYGFSIEHSNTGDDRRRFLVLWGGSIGTPDSYEIK